MNNENIEEILKNIGNEEIPADVHKIAQETSNNFSSSLRQTSQPKRLILLEQIMKSRITKLAAAAVLIAGVLVGLRFVGNPFKATLTFAEVIQPIFSAQTAIFDTIIGGEEADGPIIHDMVRGSRIRRTLSTFENVVSIIDVEAGKILTLDSEKKEAIYIDLKDWSSIPNYMERLKHVITGLQESPHFEVEELGEQEIGGQRLIGLRAKNPEAEITIWADSRTALPVRIESTRGQMTVITKNLKFDVPMDEELFSMDVPEGYTQQQTELDLHGSTEEDFIEGLRIMAEVFGDGNFPESVALEDYLKQVPAIMKKYEELGLSEQEQTELGLKLQNYVLFIRFFKGEGKWHYSGKGVKLGDTQTAIFWYRPKGSETYRVIYGDLAVKDVAPEDMPQ